MRNSNEINRRKFISVTGASLAGLYLSTNFLLSSCKGCNSRNKTKTLRLQSPWINDAEFIGYFVAIENGYYKDEGIDFTYLPGGPEIVSDSVLIARNAEIALTTPDVTINSILKQNYKFKIIGAQYQKSPLGIVSLQKNNIVKPTDLIGKTLAVPPANNLTVDAFLKINNINKEDVRIVPYQYDPKPLLDGSVDATLDFVTNVPYTISEKGGKSTSFLLDDYGFQIFNDTVVVWEDTLKENKELLKKWLKASKRGWEENFKNPDKYVTMFMNSYFKGTGRTEANEKFYNRAQQSLMETTSGLFSMSEDAIANNIKSLAAVGINATREMFVNDMI
jgi:ABC-type nitrate/sulfonate/bicarbonate transport system substrate-binding protein